ncbi:MAG: hypothetical protein RMJ37_08080 [Spirochaetia bacterium]|nr:hypothetical protein [Spirochaetota bacterium]MDW8113272.1 hypothetical protein [Spirochaetia bacterium]
MPKYDNIPIKLGYIIPSITNDIDNRPVDFNSVASSITQIPDGLILKWDSANNEYIPALLSDTFNDSSNISILAVPTARTATSSYVYTKAILNANYLYVYDNINNTFVKPNLSNLNLALHPRFRIINE